jgi:hypothetical protein
MGNRRLGAIKAKAAAAEATSKIATKRTTAFIRRMGGICHSPGGRSLYESE